MEMKLKLKQYIFENLKVQKRKNLVVKELTTTDVLKIEDKLNENIFCDVELDEKLLEDFLNKYKNEKKFQTMLFEFIDRKNLKDSDVYNKVGIDRKLFSKIRNNEDYHPSKETIILLGLSLELTEEELLKLLESASYSLSKNNIFDLIIRFCFIEQVYDLFTVNELLEEYNCNVLNN